MNYQIIIVKKKLHFLIQIFNSIQIYIKVYKKKLVFKMMMMILNCKCHKMIVIRVKKEKFIII